MQKAKPNKMKGRKNIFKIAITSVLSATMCLTGALAVKSVMPAKAFAETTVNTSSIVDNVGFSGTGAATDYGTYYDLEATSKSFTGLKLTGGTGAKFELGTIDLAKSYWNGVDMTYGTEQDYSKVTVTGDMQAKDDVTDENPRDYNKFLYDTSTENVNGKYYNGSDEFANFIAFAFAPHVNRYNKTPYDNASAPNYNKKELKGFTITLTDVSDNGNYLTIKSTEQTDSNGTGSRNFGVSGNGQSASAGMRKVGSDGPRLYSGLRVTMSDVGGANQVPYELCYSQDWNAADEASREPALYSPNGSGAAPSIAGTWLIRKFAKTTYANANCASDSAWNGFSSSKVKVTITFDEVQTVSDKNDESKTNEGVTSLIITSLGGYDLTQSEQTILDTDYIGGATYSEKNATEVIKGEAVDLYAPVKYNVIKSNFIDGSKVEIVNRNNETEATVKFDAATKAYTFKKTGVYTLKWYESEDATEAFATTTVQSNSAVVDVETAIVNNIVANNGQAAYVSGKKQAAGTTYFSGVKLTGTTGSSFDLGTFKLDNNKMYWNGSAYDASSVVTDNGKYYSGKNNHDKKSGDATSYGSFFSYVYDTASTTFELSDLAIRIEQVGKTSNYVQLYTGNYPDGQGYNIIFQAQGTNNTAYKCERNNGSGMYFGNHLRTYKTGNVTRPIDLVWDNANATLYANTTYGGGSGGYGTWAVRQFNTTASDYTSGYPDGFSPWAGFDDGAELRCVVTFAKSSTETSIIITSLGGVDLTNSEYKAEMEAVATDATGVVGAKYNLLDSVYYTDGLAKIAANVAKVTVQKDGAEATEVELSAAKAYEFDEEGVYTVTYYDNVEAIATSTYTIEALTVNLTVTGGEVRKADGTVVNNGDELNLDDVLTFVPTGSVENDRGTVAFDVIRSLSIDGNAIPAELKNGEYSINVADYVSGSTLTIIAAFDAKLNIHITDSRKNTDEALVASIWATDGSYYFSNSGYNTVAKADSLNHFVELEDGSYDMLLGFGRYTYENGEKSRVSDAPLNNKLPVSFANENGACQLDKDSYFVALWMNVKTSYQVRVGVDDSDSGLRMVTELKKDDVALYEQYNVSSLGMLARTNYTVLDHLQEAKGADFDIKSINASNWMTNGVWNPVPGSANGLGLYAPNGEETADKPLFYQYGGTTLKSYNQMVSGVTEGYIGYAVTLTNFREANINRDYVFQVVWTCDGTTGGASACVGYAKQARMSTLATEVLNAAFGEQGSDYQYTVTVDGETKYSKYTQDRVDWLRKMAGLNA